MFRRRRPLLRAAMVGGGAYYAGKKVQQGREQDADQDQNPEGAPAPPASGGISDETLDQLQKLGDLKKQGVLTEEEFEQQKQKLLQPA
jgi:hypothetical protein